MNLSRKILIAGSATIALCALASTASAQNTANAAVAINAKIIAPISITAGTALNFGTAFTNASSQTVVIAPDNSRTASGTVLASSGHTAATFTVGGTDGQLFDVGYVASGLPASFTVDTFKTTGCGLTNSATLTGLTTTSSACSLAVGATLTIPAAAAAQTVSGTLTTTVTYE